MKISVEKLKTSACFSRPELLSDSELDTESLFSLIQSPLNMLTEIVCLLRTPCRRSNEVKLK